MKKTLLLASCIALLVAACKKDHNGQEGYNFTLSYKNTLNVQVTIQSGWLYHYNGKDTTVFIEPGISVQAGATYDSVRFICLKNCPPIEHSITLASPAPYPGFTKMIIGNKVKIDTSCYYHAMLKQQTPTNCSYANANFYDTNRWKTTKDKNDNIIRQEYVIDQADLAEAH